MLGGMEAWRHGDKLFSLRVSRRGLLEAWRLGGMEAWRHGVIYWAFLAPGISCALLGAHGLSWALLGAPGLSWAFSLVQFFAQRFVQILVVRKSFQRKFGC